LHWLRKKYWSIANVFEKTGLNAVWRRVARYSDGIGQIRTYPLEALEEILKY